MSSHIVIHMESHGIGKVYVDGHQLSGVQRIEFTAASAKGTPNQVTVTLLSERVTLAGVADIALKRAEAPL